MTIGRIRRRRILQAGLAGIATFGPLPLATIGARKAMADIAPETTVYVSNAGSRDINVLAMNRNTGELTLIEKKEVPGSDKSPASLPMALSPNKRFIYAQLRGQPYPVSTFSIDHANGKLTHVDTTPLVDQMAYLNVDKSGKHLLGASYVGAKVASYPIDAHYVVEEKATQIIDTQPKAHCVFVDGANKHVYVPVLSADHIMQFKFDAATGMLTPNDPPVVKTKTGAGPRHFTIHPNGKWGYLITETTATIGTYAIDKDKGTLTEVAFVDTGDYNGKEFGLRFRHPCHSGWKFRLRRRAHHEHIARLQDRPRQGHADRDWQMADRKDAARLQYRPARQVPVVSRHGIGRHDSARDRPEQRRTETKPPLSNGHAAKLGRDR